MKIKFKHQPKYMLPIIIFPFLVGGGYIFAGKGKNPKVAAVQPSIGVNDTIPDVSKNVAQADLKTKFQTYEDAIKNGQTLEDSSYQPVSTDAQLQQAEIRRRIDSIDRVYNISPTGSFPQAATASGASSGSEANPYAAYQNSVEQQRDIMQRIFKGADGNLSPATGVQAPAQPQGESANMKEFREQMKMIDSMQQSMNGGATGNSMNREVMNDKGVHYQFTQDTGFQPETVEAVGSRNLDGFNTLRNSNLNSGQIMAMIDQDVRATAGSRVRIRLLSDMYAGNTLIPKGTYLYGFVTGFQTQRVNISVKYIQVKDKSIPVALDLYDNDGYLGLYVPGSNFREFTKQIGSQSTQGMSSVMMSDGSNVMSNILSQIFSSTTTTAANLISKNRAQLKYNYIVYLRENQSKNKERDGNSQGFPNGYHANGN